jgi:hypothetical protein
MLTDLSFAVQQAFPMSALEVPGFASSNEDTAMFGMPGATVCHEQGR